jgi:integrase
MKKFTYYFNLESKPNSSDEHLIFYNLSYGFKKYNVKTKKTTYPPVRISTEQTIKKEFWDGKPYYRTNQIYVKKFGKGMNDILNNIEDTSETELATYRKLFKKDPTPDELKKIILLSLGRIKEKSNDISIAEYTEILIKQRTKLPNTSSEFWSKTTGNQYQAIVNRLNKYESAKNINLTFGEITEEIYWDYFKTINDYQKEENGEYYTQTTINKEFRSLRAIFNCANENNIFINISYSKKSLKINSSSPTYETYLSEEQLTTIINSDTSGSKEFEHARNYIIISSFTGLRISDVIHLHKINPEKVTHNSKKYNCFTTKIRKSSENANELIVTIPILEPLKNLLGLYGNKFPAFTSEPNIRKVVKKFLKHLKFENNVETKTKYYLLDEVKIGVKKQCELIGPHDCRRSFITNLKQLGIQNDTIEPITHPKIKKASVLESYDKSTLVDKAVKLIKQLNAKDSPIFKY